MSARRHTRESLSCADLVKSVRDFLNAPQQVLQVRRREEMFANYGGTIQTNGLHESGSIFVERPCAVNEDISLSPQFVDGSE